MFLEWERTAKATGSSRSSPVSSLGLLGGTREADGLGLFAAAKETSPIYHRGKHKGNKYNKHPKLPSVTTYLTKTLRNRFLHYFKYNENLQRADGWVPRMAPAPLTGRVPSLTDSFSCKLIPRFVRLLFFAGERMPPHARGDNASIIVIVIIYPNSGPLQRKNFLSDSC